MTEPKIVYATVRESSDPFQIPIECGFDNGEKYSAILVDIDLPELAGWICSKINEKGASE